VERILDAMNEAAARLGVTQPTAGFLNGVLVSILVCF
jgi:hypothetical protein